MTNDKLITVPETIYVQDKYGVLRILCIAGSQIPEGDYYHALSVYGQNEAGYTDLPKINIAPPTDNFTEQIVGENVDMVEEPTTSPNPEEILPPVIDPSDLPDDTPPAAPPVKHPPALRGRPRKK